MGLEDAIRQWYQAYNRHDLDAVLAHLSEDVSIQFPTDPQPILGKERIRPVWSMLFSTVIPDIHEDVLAIVVQGHTGACEHIESGTFTLPAEFAEASSAKVSPSSDGRPFRHDVAAFFHFNAEGLMDRIRSYWDTGGFHKQIGMDLAALRDRLARG